MGVDAAVALFSLVFPPIVDFVKKKFLGKGQDTPEATLSTLATTKPEVMPQFVQAQASLLDAQTKYFNRDVCGIPAQWCVTLRASIRPIAVVIAFVVLVTMAVLSITSEHLNDVDGSIDKMLTVIRYSCEVILSSWFGDRLTLDK